MTAKQDIPYRVGFGWDIHKLSSGRKLFLGGIEIPSLIGEEAHSDGDVLLHAIIDSLLGALNLGDIGEHFPPGDPKWKNVDSKILAKESISLVRAKGWEIVNIDCTIITEKPKLFAYKAKIAESIANTLNIDVQSVSVKAKTKECCDSTGQGLSIEACAVSMLAK